MTRRENKAASPGSPAFTTPFSTLHTHPPTWIMGLLSFLLKSVFKSCMVLSTQLRSSIYGSIHRELWMERLQLSSATRVWTENTCSSVNTLLVYWLLYFSGHEAKNLIYSICFYLMRFFLFDSIRSKTRSDFSLHFWCVFWSKKYGTFSSPVTVNPFFRNTLRLGCQIFQCMHFFLFNGFY